MPRNQYIELILQKLYPSDTPHSRISSFDEERYEVSNESYFEYTTPYEGKFGNYAAEIYCEKNYIRIEEVVKFLKELGFTQHDLSDKLQDLRTKEERFEFAKTSFESDKDSDFFVYNGIAYNQVHPKQIIIKSEQKREEFEKKLIEKIAERNQQEESEKIKENDEKDRWNSKRFSPRSCRIFSEKRNKELEGPAVTLERFIEEFSELEDKIREIRKGDLLILSIDIVPSSPEDLDEIKKIILNALDDLTGRETYILIKEKNSEKYIQIAGEALDSLKEICSKDWEIDEELDAIARWDMP